MLSSDSKYTVIGVCVCVVANVKEEVERKLNDIVECFNAGISHSK